MNYLLDTDALSSLRRPDRLPTEVTRWFRDIAADQLHLSVITWMELEIGIRRKERVDSHQGDMLRRWKREHVARSFEGRILPITPAIADTCAALHVPDPKPTSDSLIAATAIYHGMTVITRNTVDFEPMSVEIFNPWR